MTEPMHAADAEYSRLRQVGARGWGGAAYSRRRDGWQRTVGDLNRDPHFPAPPARLLELGSGNGMVSALFAEMGYGVAGIEQSGEGVAWANALFAADGRPPAFHQGDVRAMPALTSGAYDAVIDGNCLHCIIGADRLRCLAEVRRVLRPWGAFLVSTMCGLPKSPEARARFDAGRLCLVENGRAHRALLPAETIVTELRHAGFHPIWQRISDNVWWDHLTMLAVSE